MTIKMNKMFNLFESKNTRRLRAVLRGMGFTEYENLNYFMEMEPDELFETFREDRRNYEKLIIAHNALVDKEYLRGRPHNEKKKV